MDYSKHVEFGHAKADEHDDVRGCDAHGNLEVG